MKQCIYLAIIAVLSMSETANAGLLKCLKRNTYRSNSVVPVTEEFQEPTGAEIKTNLAGILAVADKVQSTGATKKVDAKAQSLSFTNEQKEIIDLNWKDIENQYSSGKINKDGTPIRFDKNFGEFIDFFFSDVEKNDRLHKITKGMSLQEKAKFFTTRILSKRNEINDPNGLYSALKHRSPFYKLMGIAKPDYHHLTNVVARIFGKAILKADSHAESVQAFQSAEEKSKLAALNAATPQQLLEQLRSNIDHEKSLENNHLGDQAEAEREKTHRATLIKVLGDKIDLSKKSEKDELKKQFAQLAEARDQLEREKLITQLKQTISTNTGSDSEKEKLKERLVTEQSIRDTQLQIDKMHEIMKSKDSRHSKQSLKQTLERLIMKNDNLETEALKDDLRIKAQQSSGPQKEKLERAMKAMDIWKAIFTGVTDVIYKGNDKNPKK